MAESGPTVYTLVGVNGSGKTTTIAKLAKRWRDQGKSVIMAAADTFRAAAEDQLEVWAKRTGSTMIAHQPGSDPGAVAFDAVRSALARNADLVLVDTAGRLHTQRNLIEELKKIIRVIGREIPEAPHEVILVIDGTTGQNGLHQAKVFAEAAGVTGICITKLDGSSKGGIAVAIASEMRLPVKLVGIGEAAEDLRDFDRGRLPALFGRASRPAPRKPCTNWTRRRDSLDPRSPGCNILGCVKVKTNTVRVSRVLLTGKGPRTLGPL